MFSTSATRQSRLERPAPKTADVVILGGGPAGCVLAAGMAARGAGVVLVDDGKRRPTHTIESLSPGAAGQLAYLGLDAAIDCARRGPERPAEVKWATDRFEIRPNEGEGAIVDRSAFDAELLCRAAAQGSRIIRAVARRTKRADGGWVIQTDGPAGPGDLSAPFLIDATGRRGLGAKSRRRGQPLCALTGCWRGSGLPRTARTIAAAQCWLWGAPVGSGDYEATIFLDPRALHSLGGAIDERYRSLVLASGLFDGVACDASSHAVRFCDATPFVEALSAAPGYLRVGGSALSLDPISSAGVQVAIQLATSAVAAISTLMQDPSAGPLVEDFWRREVNRRASRHARWVAGLYGLAAKQFQTRFWIDRAGGGQTADKPTARLDPLPPPHSELKLAEPLRFVDVPCLVGERIEMRRALVHSALEEPTAFVQGHELAPLLASICPGVTAARLVEEWARRIQPADAMSILSWAWRSRIIV